MKKLLYIALSLVAATFVACDEDIVVGEVDLGYLKLIESNVNFDYHGGSGTILVDTDLSITATVAPDAEGTTWASTSIQGNTVTVTVPVNTGLENRHTSVTLKAGDRSVVVPVSQTSSALDFSTKALSFSKEKGSQTITFTPDDVVLTATVVEADRSWLSTQINAGSIVVSVEGNAGSERTSKISVIHGTLEIFISVTQATSLTTSVTSLAFEPGASSRNATFDATEGVEVTATANVPWVTASVDLAAQRVSVAVLDNTGFDARSGVLTLETSGGVKANIAITQRGWTMAELTWEPWANGTYLGNGLGRQKATTLSKAKAVNAFRIDSPYATSGFHFVFLWDIDNKDTAISPVALFMNDFLFGVPLPVQDTGMRSGSHWAMWITDPDPEYTYYSPSDKAFTLNSYYGAFLGGQNTVEAYGGYFAQWTDDYYVISEFLKGNPWE